MQGRRQRMNLPTPKVEQASDVTILTFTGGRTRDIGNRIAADLEGRTEGQTGGHFLLDFSKVERISSEDLGTLVGLHRRVREAAGRLTLFNLSPDVYDVFLVTRLHTLLAICREQDPAP